jgi:hypothetical protein
MEWRRAIACGVVGAVLVAGCGGSGGHQTSPVGLDEQVLTNNELPGFSGAQPTVQRGVSAWLTDITIPETSARQIASQRAELNRLKTELNRLGFVAGVHKNLIGPRGLPGVSNVEAFRSPDAARAELAAEVQKLKKIPGHVPFPVAGIPAALGIGFRRSPPAVNVAFTSGDNFYVVGKELPSLTNSAEQTLIAAARHLYHRLRS